MPGQTIGGMNANIHIQTLTGLDGRLIAVLFRLRAHGSARLGEIGRTGRTEDIRPKLVPADPSKTFHREAMMSRHKAGLLPASDVLRAKAASLSQTARTTRSEGFNDLFDAIHASD